MLAHSPKLVYYIYMIEIILLTFICAETVIFNHTSHWYEQDSRTLERAKQRCGKIFPKYPCLKRFTKVQDDNYWAVCGKEKG